MLGDREPVFRDLRAFVDFLEAQNDLARIGEPVSTVLEVTELHRRVLARQGPALLLENAIKSDGEVSRVPLLTNLFGTVERISLALGGRGKESLKKLGEMLAQLREPVAPSGLREALRQWPWPVRPLHRALRSFQNPSVRAPFVGETISISGNSPSKPVGLASHRRFLHGLSLSPGRRAHLNPTITTGASIGCRSPVPTAQSCAG